MTRSNALFRSLESRFFKSIFYFIRLLEKGKSKTPSPNGAQNILVCKWCCMGDAILSLYAIREYKFLYPEAKIEVLVSSRIAEVYQQAPEIAKVHLLPITGHRLFLEVLKPILWWKFLTLLVHLRKKKFTQFVDLELYRSTGPILKRILGIAYSRGFQVDGAIPKGHDFEVPRKRNMPEWQCFFLVLGLIIPMAKPGPLFLNSYPKPLGKKKKIGIVYGSSFNWPQKKWPWAYYAETISLLGEQKFEFLLLGTTLEKEEGALIAQNAKGDIRDLTGKLNYASLAQEVADCDLIVGNDTGTLHLASAYGVPTMTIFGPTDPEKWNGLTSTALFKEDLECRPCYYLGSMPDCSHFSCLRKLAPSLVAERVCFLLGPR